MARLSLPFYSGLDWHHRTLKTARKLNDFYNWKPLLGTILLEVSAGRVWGSKASRLYNWKPFLGTTLLEVSLGRDLGLESLTPLQLETLFGDKIA